jgi:hypothetical protein
MKVHLIKDGDVSNETFTEVFDLLNSIDGPIQFVCDNNSLVNFSDDDVIKNLIVDQKKFEASKKLHIAEYSMGPVKSRKEFKTFTFPFKRKTSSWDILFGKCNKYRQQNEINSNEFVLLLTEMSNDKNWFASLDEKMPFNGFIHTADWNHFIKCDDAFPIAYEVIALILQKHIFNDYNEVRTSVHIDPIGCVNDMCYEKKDIKLKMRTADICPDCMGKLKGKLSFAEINQCLNILESLRVKMLFSQNFRQNVPLSRLVIDERKRIFLPDFGNIEIKLRPLEKTLYLFYLNHPEGVGLSFLRGNRNELYDIYAGLSSLGNLEEMRGRIDDMTDISTNSALEKISKIKAAFVRAIGDELAKHYYIQRGYEETKKVVLDSKLVIYKNNY